MEAPLHRDVLTLDLVHLWPGGGDQVVEVASEIYEYGIRLLINFVRKAAAVTKERRL